MGLQLREYIDPLISDLAPLWQRHDQPHCPPGEHTGGQFTGPKGGNCAADKLAPNPLAATPEDQGGLDQQPKAGNGLGEWFMNHPQEYAAYRDQVMKAVQAAVDSGQSTEDLNSDGNGNYTAERRAMQKQMEDKIYAAEAANKPLDHVAVLMGGLPGAGKTTALNDFAKVVGIDVHDFAGVNADDLKKAYIEAGLVPPHPDFSPMEGSYLVHEESSTAAKNYFDRLVNEGRNIALDATMGNKGSFLDAQKGYITKLIAKGYKIKMVFVDTTIPTSVRRAHERHMRDIDSEFGGRMVPDKEIVGSKSSHGYNSRNRDNYEDMKTHADEWYTFDNDGSAPKLIDSWDERHKVQDLARMLREIDVLRDPFMAELDHAVTRAAAAELAAELQGEVP